MTRARELAELAAAYDSGGLSNMKNRIINGDMRIDQRNAGASVTLDAAGNVTYGMDRFWGADDTDGVVTLQQITDAPSGFTNSARITITTADASLSASQYLVFSQRVEGFNVADFAFGSASAATVTLSFWVKSSLTGTFGGSLRNSAANRSYPFTYTISSANTWEQKSITIAGDTTGTWLTNNGIGVSIFWGLGVGSSSSGTAGSWSGSNFLSATGAVSVVGTLNATWQITGVQLEKGSTATSFDYRPYTTELQLCQRYYQIKHHVATTSSANTTVHLLVDMRAQPTVGTVTIDAGSGAAFSAFTTTNAVYQTLNNSAGPTRCTIPLSSEL